jgi:hypothetical protein
MNNEKHEENLLEICKLLGRVKASKDDSLTTDCVDIYRVENDKKVFTKVGECDAKLGGGLDIVIIDKSYLPDYINGEVIPLKDVEPMLDRTMVMLGYLFIYKNFVYMCDPREDTVIPFEDVLSESRIANLISNKDLINKVNFNLKNMQQEL